MDINDLEYIFKTQLDSIGGSDIKLFFMTIDGDHKIVHRHSASDLDGILPMLGCFVYSGSEAGVPRFSK